MPIENADDVQRTLSFTTQKVVVGSLPLALGLLLLGLVAARFTDRDGAIAGWLLIVFSLVGIGFIVWRRTTPGPPMLVLSPDGIDLRIIGVKVVRIPWREIRAIDSGDVVGSVWLSRGPTSITFKDVTSVLVSRSFYEAHIHVDSWFMRGPGWDANFQPHDEVAKVIIHHEPLSLDPKELRAAIEARWRAFRGMSDVFESVAATPTAQRTAPRTTSAITTRRGWFNGGARPAHSSHGSSSPPPSWFASRWDVLKISLALIGIAVVLGNAAGLWETKDQMAKRLERAKWAEDLKRDQEETRKREKYWQEFWKDFDRSFSNR
jgi:hypothetical protein